MPGFYDVKTVDRNIFLPGIPTAGATRTLWLTDNEIHNFESRNGVSIVKNNSVNSAPDTSGIIRYRDKDDTDDNNGGGGGSGGSGIGRIRDLTVDSGVTVGEGGPEYYLTPEDNGWILVYKDEEDRDLYVHVGNDLPRGFSVGIAQWDYGVVRLLENGDYVRNRSDIEQTSDRRKMLSLIVMTSEQVEDDDGNMVADIEFIVGEM